MADVKWSALTAVTDLQDTDILSLVRSTANNKITGANLKAQIVADATNATQAELDAHVNDASAAHAATAVSADSTTLVGTGTTVQAVFEELDDAIATNVTNIAAAVPKSLYDANTVLAATSDDTPAAVTMAASTVLARLASGNIVAATVAQMATLLAPALPGYQLDYVERTTSLTVTATTEATADAFVTGSAVTYDGSTVIEISFFVPYVDVSDSTIGIACLYDGASSIGKICAVQQHSSGGQQAFPGGVFRRVITPSAASHTYSIRCAKVVGSSALAFNCGAGGSGNYLPAFIRIVKV